MRIYFILTINDVGRYEINFSIMDDNPDFENAIGSKVVNFTVLVINEPPFFNYVCDNERDTIEDTPFVCGINASDLEEENNLTFTSDVPWFLDQKSSLCNIGTGFNASVDVDFQAKDENVGNWSINISVRDTGNPVKSNSTSIWFFVENLNDPVSLEFIENQTCYPGNSNHIPLKAFDEDLLIPTSSNPLVYQEDLDFSIKYSDGRDISWVSLSEGGSMDNFSIVYLDFTSTVSNVGLHLVNLSVSDKNYYSLDSQIFLINISGNFPPVWVEPLQTDFSIQEDDVVYLDFSKNVTDEDSGDVITFSYISDNLFPSFDISSSGIISFPAEDEDVGEHIVEITASDGKTNVPKNFRFIISNIHDSLDIINPLEAINMSNDRILEDSNIHAEEDKTTKISMFVEDDDLKILQKSFYDEDITLNLIIEGPNPNLFDFMFTFNSGNTNLYNATFIPRKSDIGDYNITINATDKSGFSDDFNFNLTITSVEHPPVLMNFTNYTAVINENFYLDIDSSDLEDINDSFGSFIYSYSFINGTDFINENINIFNPVTGELNITLNDIGSYRINITVEDSGGLTDSNDFWLFVYDGPLITYPTQPCLFELQENFTSDLIFRASHAVGDNLTYQFYLGSELKSNLSYYGNNTNFTWNFIPDFDDETYGGFEDLTLVVSNPYYPELSDSLTCQASITHSNAPVVFEGWIGDKSTTHNLQIAIDLKDYFSDIDHNDSYYNQEVNFVIASSSSPSSIFTNFDPSTWILKFSASGPVNELLNITGIDSEDSSVVSNNFTIEFTEPEKKTVTTEGGGSSGSGVKIISLKILTPEKISAYADEKIEIPFSLFNTGTTSFKDLYLSAFAYKNGSLANEINTSLDKDYLVSLTPGQKENLILTVFFPIDKLGDYEVLINVNSTSPRYSDWGKIHINLQRINESRVREIVLFTEEFIVRNPQCIEIKELINEAKRLFEEGNSIDARLKAEEAMSACEESISQVSVPRPRDSISYDSALYLFLTILFAIIVGVVYYLIKRRAIQKAGNIIKENLKINGEGFGKNLKNKA